MKIIKKKITIEELKKITEKTFGNLIKAVVDVEKEIMAIDAELHADEETYLLENGSKQKNLWGINLYPDLSNDDFIEFDSMINLRPTSGNNSRGVDDQKLREKITKIVSKLIQK